MYFTVLLILFVLIGSASAANDNITSLSQDTDNEISQEKISTGNNVSSLKEIENKEQLKTTVSGDTFADIQTAIDSAEIGDTIELDGLYKGSGTSIIIDKNNLTIIGNDAILDSQGQSRILNITGTGILLKDINFINGNTTDNGGAIYWYGANGTAINCNFINNTATQRGGAIYCEGTNETIINSNFINNTAAKYCGGAINWGPNSANGTVNNCNFTNNTATQRGGAIYCEGTNETIINSNFINSASIAGGAINWSPNSFNGVLNNSSFINNTGDDGGAIYWEGTNGRMNNCNFTSNTGNNGGAINWQKRYGLINNCNFANNTATEKGGAIFWEGTNGTATNCNFTNNKATQDGGAVYWYAFNGTVNMSNFSNNTAESDGGAIYWDNTDGNIFDSIFKGNKAANYTNVYSSGDLVLLNSTLETFIIINQIPDSYAGNSATVYFTFDDGTNLGGYNVTLYNNGQIIKTFKYEGSYYYDYTWDELAAGNYSITVGEINTKRNNYIASYEPMNFKVIKYSTRVVINPIANVTYKSEVVVDFTVENRTNISIIITDVLTGETKTFYNITESEFRINNLVPSTYNITIINCENEMYASSNASALFSVAKILIKGNKDMSVYYREGAKFTVRIVDENGNPVSGKLVTFKVNGVKYTAVSNANGYASCNINWKPGKSHISTSCGDSTVLNTIRVKSVIHANKNFIVKKSKKITQFKIALYGLKAKIVKKPSFKYNGRINVPIKIGKDLAGKKVSVKFKGKYFSTKVNSKGIGVLKISKKLARELKLKKSKNYKALATYEKRVIYKNKAFNVKIYGKTYTTKTNKKGMAVFKITKKMVNKLKIGKKYPYYIKFGENIAKGNLIIKK